MKTKAKTIKKEKENKILLITTRGCEGCAIISKLIHEAISISKIRITFETKDVKEVDKKFLKQNKVTDFPTVFLMQNDDIKFSFVGTRPSIVISRWIDVYLNKMPIG